MIEVVRKKSPRAPSIPLSDAIEGALKVYEQEHRHAAPIEAVAQHLGYKSANNGAALKQIASIRYYGLIDRPAEGQLAVSKDLEAYRFGPSSEIKDSLVRRWLKTPPVFAELLDRYPNALPSDQTLRYDLIQRGFLPDAVDVVVGVFRASVDFARYYETRALDNRESNRSDASSQSQPALIADPSAPVPGELAGFDRIPIRLPGGRRAYVEVPSPFFEADKDRIKKQIDLLLTEEDESPLT